MIDALQATNPRPLTASDLRASLAWAGVRAYCVAARLRIHPTTFSQILNGHRLFDQEQGELIVQAIEAERLDSVGRPGLRKRNAYVD